MNTSTPTLTIDVFVRWNQTCQKILHVQKFRHHFFKLKLVSTVPNQFNGSISMSAVNLEKIGRGQIFDLSPKEQKLAIFKTCSDSLNMGVIRSMLMPVVTLPSFKMIGRLEVP